MGKVGVGNGLKLIRGIGGGCRKIGRRSMRIGKDGEVDGGMIERDGRLKFNER